MAEVQDVQVPQEQQQNAELSRLKRDLEGYRELILPFNKVLEWEQNHYPAILVAIITFVFAIIWYIEPSVLTCFSMIGVTLCLVDFVVPAVSGYFFSASEWTVVQERQFENICIRLLNAKTHLINLKNNMFQLKNEKPKAYLLVMMGAFAVLAWVGSLIDNLLLTYLLGIFVVLVPGLRKHGILQKFTNNAAVVVKRLLMGVKDGEKKAEKSKTN